MGLFSRKAAHQVGDQPQANNPDLHMIPTPGAPMRAIEWTGDDYAEVQHQPPPLRAVRPWRLGSQVTPAGAAPDGDVAHATERASAADAHLSVGTADARRVDPSAAGNAAAPAAAYAPSPELRSNTRDDVQLAPEAPPSRPRAGFTGADPTRAAQVQTAFTIRPFDQGMAQHPGTVERVNMDSPTAARPPERKRLLGGRPSAAGSEGTGMTPVGPQRNTVRQQPGAWDERLVNPGTSSAATTAARAGGWRAR